MLEKFRGKWTAGKSTAETAKPAAENNAPNGVKQVVGAELEQALTNPAEKIRLAAVQQLDDPTRLLDICLRDNSDKIRQIAARQYTRHLADDQDTLDLLKQYAGEPESRELAKTITGYSQHNRVREFGSALFSEQSDLADLAINTRFHDTRSDAIERLSSIDEMDRCWRQIKSKDKIAARALKARLDHHHQAQQLELEQRQITEKLVESMQTLSNSVWSPHYPNTHAQLDTRWNGLDFTPDAKLRESFEAAACIVRAKVEEHAALAELHETRATTLQQLSQLHDALLACSAEQLNTTIASTTSTLASIDNTWAQLAEQAAASDAEQQPFDRHQHRLKRVLKIARAVAAVQASTDQQSLANGARQLSTLEKTQKQVAEIEPEPAFASELPTLASALRDKLEQQQRSNSELKQSVAKQLGALQGAIRANRWGPAKSIHDRLARKIARLDDRDKQSHSEKLERLGKQLKDLGDWKEFASQPKLEALCEQMEALPAAGLAPRDQADRIKDLQTQWKAFGASPAQEQLWPRFKLAADTAYEPCKQYFAARREEKNANLDHRGEISNLLEKYIEACDWDNPDWRLVEKTVRTARNEWRNLRVFDRKASKPLDQRFDALIKTLNDRLDPVYEANAAEKAELIEKVRQLGEGEINQHCINQVKRLQSVWKTGGIMRRKSDQALWKEFNAACGAIFNVHREQQREQYQSSIEHVTRARSIIAELKKIAGGSSFDEKQLQALQDEFQQLPEFPERDARYLRRDFTRVLNDVEKGRQNASDSSRRAEIERLRHKAELCEQLEALAGGTPSELEAQMAAILDEWQEGEKTDKAEWRKAMNLRRDSILLHLQNGSLPDYEKNTADRRILCIELEILLDRETPAEDRNLRMQHQLQKLQQGMTSNATVSKQAQLEQLSNQWLCAFPADPAVRDKLKQRFDSTLQAASAK